MDRAQPLFTAIVALICWWFIQPKRGTSTERQAKSVAHGMSRDDLLAAIGQPAEGDGPTEMFWKYEILAVRGKSSTRVLIVLFEVDDRVCKVHNFVFDLLPELIANS